MLARTPSCLAARVVGVAPWVPTHGVAFLPAMNGAVRGSGAAAAGACRAVHVPSAGRRLFTTAKPLPDASYLFLPRYRLSMSADPTRRRSSTRLLSTVKGSNDPASLARDAPAKPDAVAAPAPAMSSYGKLKLIMEQYGPIAIVTYLSIYVTTLGTLFAGITYGIDPAQYGLDPEHLVGKVSGMLEAYTWADPLRELIEKNPSVANFALAWIMTKFTEPVRAVATLAVVPRIARALGRGLPRPPPPPIN